MNTVICMSVVVAGFILALVHAELQPASVRHAQNGDVMFALTNTSACVDVPRLCIGSEVKVEVDTKGNARFAAPGNFSFNAVDIQALVSRMDNLVTTVARQQEELSYLRISSSIFRSKLCDRSRMQGLGGQPINWLNAITSDLSGKTMVYAAPFYHQSVLIIDPTLNTADTTSVDTGDTTPSKYSGIVAVPETRLIYCLPRVARHILVFDPVSLTWSKVPFQPPGLSAGGHWHGAVYTNGKVYCMPSSDGGNSFNAVLVFDPSTNSTDITSILVTPENSGWTHGAVGPNGKIYCPPSAGTPSSGRSVLIVDPATNTTDQVTIAGLTDGYSNAVFVSSAGLIYAFPSSSSAAGAKHMLIINPNSNVANELVISGLPSDSHICGSTALASDGMLYCMPQIPTAVAVFNPRDNSTSFIDTTTCGASSGGFKWAGASQAGHILYGVPHAGSTVLLLPIDS